MILFLLGAFSFFVVVSMLDALASMGFVRALICLLCLGSGHFDDMDTRLHPLESEMNNKHIYERSSVFGVRNLTWNGKDLAMFDALL